MSTLDPGVRGRRKVNSKRTFFQTLKFCQHQNAAKQRKAERPDPPTCLVARQPSRHQEFSRLAHPRAKASKPPPPPVPLLGRESAEPLGTARQSLPYIKQAPHRSELRPSGRLVIRSATQPTNQSLHQSTSHARTRGPGLIDPCRCRSSLSVVRRRGAS